MPTLSIADTLVSSGVWKGLTVICVSASHWALGEITQYLCCGGERGDDND